jgi:hypothetical protein
MAKVRLTLLDEVLPEYDYAAKYSIRIRATPERIYKILQNGIPTGNITRFLMMLRRIPGLFRRKGSADYSFYKLKEWQGREIVIGIAGQFWKPVAKTVAITNLDEFLSFDRNGFCKAALNLQITRQEDGVSVLSTETRVLSFGYAKEDFRSYWQLIKPFSGMIRREILRKIKRQAELLPQS